jgi:hypothetical protein
MTRQARLHRPQQRPERSRAAAIDLWLSGIGAWAPGVASWPQLAALLAGQGPGPVADSPAGPPPARLLAAAERRRAAPATRLALQAAAEALAAAGVDPGGVRSVFATSSGSPDLTDELCRSVVTGPELMSPTKFHNSVHNAAGGYYGIATGSRLASTTVCAHDDSAAAGLLECAAQLADGGSSVLLVSYDHPYDGPLALARPLDGGWALAMVLEAFRRPLALARLRVGWSDAATMQTVLADPQLEKRRCANPTARLLPLLQLVAATRGGRVVLGGPGGGTLAIEVAPRCVHEGSMMRSRAG